MPVMDGLTALPKLLAANPQVRIIMASTLTQRNAGSQPEGAGAGRRRLYRQADHRPVECQRGFPPRAHPESDRAGPAAESRPVARMHRPATAERRSSRCAPASAGAMRRPRIIAIGSSTGGPQALLTLLGALPRTVDCPIVIAQHMPATFTTVLAQHIAAPAGAPAPKPRMAWRSGRDSIYLAPGDFHFQIAREGTACVARLSQTAAGEFLPPVRRSAVSQRGAACSAPKAAP